MQNVNYPSSVSIIECIVSEEELHRYNFAFYYVDIITLENLHFDHSANEKLSKKTQRKYKKRESQKYL